MINQMQKSVCALAVLAATALPVMAESVDVHVIGKIKPAACTPTISGGSTVDYGNISVDMLSPTGFTVLPVKEVDFTITCDALAKIAVDAVNGRPATLAGAVEGGTDNVAVAPVTLTTAGRYAAGLGLATDGAQIGGYAISLGKGTADGVSVNDIYRYTEGGTTTWTASRGGDLYNARNMQISWATSGTTPVAFKTLTSKLSVQAYLNNTTALDVSDEIDLNGLTTIELVYL